MAGLRARAGRVSGPCSGGFCELQPVSGERMEGEDAGTAPCRDRDRDMAGPAQRCQQRAATVLAVPMPCPPPPPPRLGPANKQTAGLCALQTRRRDRKQPRLRHGPAALEPAGPGRIQPQEQLEHSQATPRQSHVLGKCGWECGFLRSQELRLRIPGCPGCDTSETHCNIPWCVEGCP